MLANTVVELQMGVLVLQVYAYGGSMRIATWNVNSIRARAQRVEEFLIRENIDVLAIQETKAKPEQIPVASIEAAGYEFTAWGINQWNGVAIASRVGLSEVQQGFAGQPQFNDTLEPRALAATCGGVRVWSLYVPNGREVGHAHYTYKLAWLRELRSQAASWLENDPEALIALTGDWNIAPQDEDVWDMAEFAGCTHVTGPEREAFAAFLAAGYSDRVRELASGRYTYWDYQGGRFWKDHGMRIDFALTSPALSARLVGAQIDREERKGKGASDHAPVIIEYA